MLTVSATLHLWESYGCSLVVALSFQQSTNFKQLILKCEKKMKITHNETMLSC